MPPSFPTRRSSYLLGRRVAERLADLGFAVRVATRHPEQQQRQGLTSVAADVNDEASVAAVVAGCFGVVNAVSLYVERSGQTFDSVHVEAAGRVARSAKAAGVERLAHLSGIGSDPGSSSPYIASRGRGEQAVRSEEHTSELKSLMRTSYAVLCLKK